MMSGDNGLSLVSIRLTFVKSESPCVLSVMIFINDSSKVGFCF